MLRFTVSLLFAMWSDLAVFAQGPDAGNVIGSTAFDHELLAAASAPPPPCSVSAWGTLFEVVSADIIVVPQENLALQHGWNDIGDLSQAIIHLPPPAPLDEVIVRQDASEQLGSSSAIVEPSAKRRRGRPSNAQLIIREFSNGHQLVRPASVALVPAQTMAIVSVGAFNASIVRDAAHKIVIKSSQLFGLKGQQSLAAPLRHSLELFRRSPASDRDHCVIKFGHSVLQSRAYQLRSLTTLASQMGCSEKRSKDLVRKCAAFVHEWDQMHNSRLEELLTQNLFAAQLLQYNEFPRYDESSFMLNALDDESRIEFSCIIPGHPDAREVAPDSALVDQRLQTFSIKIAQPSMVSKILQTNLAYSMLVKSRTLYPCIVTDPLAHLQLLERTTGECVCSAQLAISSATITASRASSNDSAERMIKFQRVEGWECEHEFCGSHDIAGCYNKSVGKLMRFDIIGTIHWSRTLQLAAQMSCWRKCMATEIVETLSILNGSPPEHVTLYRKHVLQVFVSHGRNCAVRRVLLTVLPRGNWQDTSVVEYYVPFGPQAQKDPKAIAITMTDGIVGALAGSRPWTYNESKWTGAELATDDAGIVEACHGLLHRTNVRFMHAHGHRVPVNAAVQIGALPLLSLEAGPEVGNAEERAHELDRGDVGERDAKADDKKIPTDADA
jgi:hypothetical protein